MIKAIFKYSITYVDLFKDVLKKSFELEMDI